MIRQEREPQFKEEFEEKKDPEAEKMEGIIESISSELEEEGVPVNKECRINPDAFQDVYRKEDLKKDKELVGEREKEFYKKSLGKGLSMEKIKEERKKSIGDKMEMLTTAIFYKNLAKDFVVVRASRYDDIKNGVDNVIVKRKTGNIVCALDEVGDNFGADYEKKKDKILRENVEINGVKVKYGFRVKQGDKKLKLELGERKNIPIFYLALPEEYIKKLLKSFKPSLKEQSDDEKKLFSYFITKMKTQIGALQVTYIDLLHPKLKKRVDSFKQAPINFETKGKIS